MRYAFLVLLLVSLACSGQGRYEPRDGDIIFQTSRSGQSLAIQLATGSPYSHMGIVYLRNGVPFVFEAVQPVKMTPLKEWIARGEDRHFVVKRLRRAESILSPENLRKMREIGDKFIGLDYDFFFEWSDDRIYCSELVWKIFARGAGVKVGKLATLRDFDLSHPAVKAKIGERFGNAVPLDEMVISPAAMFASPMVETVYEN